MNKLKVKFEKMGIKDLYKTMKIEHKLLYKAQFFTGFLQSSTGQKIHNMIVDEIQDIENKLLKLKDQV